MQQVVGANGDISCDQLTLLGGWTILGWRESNLGGKNVTFPVTLIISTYTLNCNFGETDFIKPA